MYPYYDRTATIGMKRGLMKRVIGTGEVNSLVGGWILMAHRVIRYFIIGSISLLRINGLALPFGSL